MTRGMMELLAAVEDGALAVTADRIICFANLAASRILGCDAASIVGRHVDVFLPTLDLERAESVAAVALGGHSLPIPVRCRTLGEGLTAVLLPQSETARFVRLYGFMQSTLENVSDGFALFDANDRLVMCNQRYLAQLPSLGGRDQAIGRSYEQILRRAVDCGDICVLGDNRERLVDDLLTRHREAASCVFMQRLCDGSWIRVQERRTEEGATVVLRTDVTELKQREIELEESRARAEFLAGHDPLTGLPNRLLLEDRMQQAFAKTDRNGSGLAILYLDLDGFKEVNDTRGHAEGDLLLRRVAVRLQKCIRDGDTVARLGGDEFVVLLDVTVDQARARAAQVAERILGSIGHALRLPGGPVHLSCSIGIALLPEHGQDPDLLLRLADMALYRTKAEGKNAYRFFEEKRPPAVAQPQREKPQLVQMSQPS